ncbi:hypothetical protein F441_07773 [Phytophthora nicotianae CJ01A1]|uniref:Uncharacterized protein n=1 Tax=Phytophthora nicotianae CJ01A1 TaxID=1317063 RepID=W2X5A7_PHYNI|nr:hypothetical protein F441_07773 [Phytophthora nicotianae CJ01A1]
MVKACEVFTGTIHINFELVVSIRSTNNSIQRRRRRQTSEWLNWGVIAANHGMYTGETTCSTFIRAHKCFTISFRKGLPWSENSDSGIPNLAHHIASDSAATIDVGIKQGTNSQVCQFIVSHQKISSISKSRSTVEKIPVYGLVALRSRQQWSCATTKILARRYLVALGTPRHPAIIATHLPLQNQLADSSVHVEPGIERLGRDQCRKNEIFIGKWTESGE